MKLDTRKHDVAQVEKSLKSSDPVERRVAKDAETKLKSQMKDSWLSEARSRLVEEKLNGRQGNVRDISESIHKKTTSGSSSFYFNLPDSFFER